MDGRMRPEEVPCAASGRKSLRATKTAAPKTAAQSSATATQSLTGQAEGASGLAGGGGDGGDAEAD